MSAPPLSTAAAEELDREAREVLRANDLGDFTRPAPTLYPHQWSWDSAFIALGLVHVDVRRAARELEHLFAGQWRDGRLPHIVFDPDVGPEEYFPGPDRWGCEVAHGLPEGMRTSGICQPAVHALAALRIWTAAERQDDGEARSAVARLYPRLVDWHRYLATARDPDGTGLVTIYHPWESGGDNSPRWDRALEAVRPDPSLPAYTRHDLGHVADPSERPTQAHYDQYLWLVELLKRVDYDDERVHGEHPFLIADVLSTAVLVRANEALAELGEQVGASDEEVAQLRRWAQRGRAALENAWDEQAGLFFDRDLRAGEPVRVRTTAGFAALIAGGLPTAVVEAQIDCLDSAWFCGAEGLRWPLPPSTSPVEPAFSPRRYWRGPVWPIVDWLLWRGLLDAGHDERARRLLTDSLAQVAAEGFAEYFDPYTGDPLGSPRQSWTAAVVLDWLDAA